MIRHRRNQKTSSSIDTVRCSHRLQRATEREREACLTLRAAIDGMKPPPALSWSSLGSLVATAVVVRAAVQEVLPPEAHVALRALLARAAAALALAQPTDTIVVHEADANGVPNELYEAAQLYLGARCLASAPALHLHKAHGAPGPVASLPDDHAARDTFRGVRVAWRSQRVDQGAFGGGTRGGFGVLGGGMGGGRQQRCLRLEFPRRHRDVVRGAYVDHVLAEAAALRLRMRDRRLYTNSPGMFCGGGGGVDDHQMMWSSHPFKHPSTFDTLAVDPALRDAIRDDLLRFVRRREHYARAGRAWKRGYLLHGPPGTGKTSLIAAIANLLEFDIYDLELTAVGSNSDLRRLLASTRPKSLIVVEDIDCSLGLFDRTRTSSSPSQDAESDDPGTPRSVRMSPFPHHGRREKISLSGVLNFVDGLWSSCVGERLIVFTTNHVDRLDPALLRPGRMDRKIELGYCKGHALRVLAKNYLGDDDREPADDDRYEELMGDAERLLEEVHLTPADVAEVFMGCEGDGAHAALQRLVDDLNTKSIAQKSAVSKDV